MWAIINILVVLVGYLWYWNERQNKTIIKLAEELDRKGNLLEAYFDRIDYRFILLQNYLHDSAEKLPDSKLKRSLKDEYIDYRKDDSETEEELGRKIRNINNKYKKN